MESREEPFLAWTDRPYFSRRAFDFFTLHGLASAVQMFGKKFLAPCDEILIVRGANEAGALVET